MKTTNFVANYQNDSKSIFEQCGGTYHEENGILYPDLELPATTKRPIGKYGQMRLDYLKNHRRGMYTTLLTECRLIEHLYQIDIEARERVAELMEAFKVAHGITEELKAADPMRWVQEMNNIRERVDEVIRAECIYV